jgi:uncharacterized membrane protein
MAVIEASVIIRRPIEEVFAYVTDIKNLPLWESGSLEAERTSPGEASIGATAHGVDKVMGRRMAWTSIVKEYESDRKYNETVTIGSTLMDVYHSYASVDGGTRFTLKYVIRASGLLKLLAPFVAISMRKQTKENLSNLKRILEAQG